MGFPKPRLTAELREEVRALYAAGELSNKEIGRRYGKAANWVNQLAAQYGWPLRTKSKPATVYGGKVRSPHSHKPLTDAQRRAEREAEQARLARDLYGDLLPDVEYLRRKMPVSREGALIRVGGTLRTEEEVRAIAARERRLEQPAPALLATIERPARNTRSSGGGLKGLHADAGALATPPEAEVARGPLDTTTAGAGGDLCRCGRNAVHPGRCWARRGMDGPPVPKEARPSLAARVAQLEAELAVLRSRLQPVGAA